MKGVKLINNILNNYKFRYLYRVLSSPFNYYNAGKFNQNSGFSFHNLDQSAEKLSFQNEFMLR